MKLFTKFALASMALVSVVANAGIEGYSNAATPTAATNTNGNLFLVVRDETDTTRVGVYDLNVSLDSLLTQANIIATNGLTGLTDVQLSNGAAIKNFSFNLGATTLAGLSDFLSVSSAAGYKYGVFAGDFSASSGANSVLVDSLRMVATTKTDYSTSAVSTVRLQDIGGTTGGIRNVNATAFGFNTTLTTPLNADFVVDPAFNFANSPSSNFGGTSTGNRFQDAMNAVGDSAFLYVYTSNGQTSGTTLARAYQLGTANLNAAGTFSITSSAASVPLPGALWLLGSGLAGLASIGRRRKLAAA